MVLNHRADQQQTKSFVNIWCSSHPKLFVCCCSALCFKTVAPTFFDGSSDKPGPQPTVQHTMSTKLPLLYSVFGLAGTGGQKNPFWPTLSKILQTLAQNRTSQSTRNIFSGIFQNSIMFSPLEGKVNLYTEIE